MPLIDVTYPKGALTAQAVKTLEAKLWSTALRWEAIEVNASSATVAWVYMDERPPQSVSVGGRPMSQNVYRINVRVMAGFMDQQRIDGMAKELTDAILAADGTPGDGSGPRVFCIVEEIPSGVWSIDGTTWTTVHTARQLGLDQRRVDAMQRAIAERPRIQVAATPG